MSHPYDGLPCPSTYSRLMLQRRPAAASRLLAGTALTPEALVRQGSITVAEQLTVFRNARALTARPDWALDFGRWWIMRAPATSGAQHESDSARLAAAFVQPPLS